MALRALSLGRVAPDGARATGLLGELERRFGVTPAGLILVLLAVGGWILGRVLGGRAAYLLAYGGLGLFGGAILIARRRRPVSAERSELARRARVGQKIDVTLSLTAARRVTTFRVEEQLHPHLGST